MTCKEIQAVMVEYLDRATDAATIEAVAAHLATCEDCRQEAEELQELMRTMAGHEMRLPGPGLRENFQLMLQSELNMAVADKLLHEGGDARMGGEESIRGEGEQRVGGAGDGRGKAMVIKKAFPVWHVAAAVLLLLGGGVGIGMLISSRKVSSPSPNSNTPESWG